MSITTTPSPPTASASQKVYRFVVAGGSYAAISAVKILGNDILPGLIAAHKDNFKVAVTVVAPNREAYWNVAAVRIVSDPDLLDTHTKQLFYPLTDTLQQYFPAEYLYKLNVIQGKILAVDPEENKITYVKIDEDGVMHEDGMFGQTLSYDNLVLATGASSSSAAFKLNGTSEDSKAALRELHTLAHSAGSIAIVGGGGVGVELAGELGYKYGKTKKITLFTELDRTLPALKPKISEKAIKMLHDLGVETVTNHRAVSILKEEDSFDLDAIRSAMTNIRSPAISATAGTTNTSSKPDTSGTTGTSGAKAAAGGVNGKSAEHVEHSPPLSAAAGSRLYKLMHPKHQHHDSNSTSHADSNRAATDKYQRQHVHEHPVPNSNSKSSSFSPAAEKQDAFITNGSSAAARKLTPRKLPRTVITFQDGSKKTYECCIPTTGNSPNTQYLPYDVLDANGYVLVDDYLRMREDNPYRNIYVIGDLVSGGRETIDDITVSQTPTLRATLVHDLVDKTSALKKYVISPPSYLVPISKKGGVGTLNGFSVPSAVVTWMKGRDFRMDESHKYLE